MNKKELDAVFETRVRALGYAVMRISNWAENGIEGGPDLTDLRFNLVADNRTNVLLVLKGVGEEGAVVGFAGGLDFATTLLAVAKKLKGGSLRWREDKPWSG